VITGRLLPQFFLVLLLLLLLLLLLPLKPL